MHARRQAHRPARARSRTSPSSSGCRSASSAARVNSGSSSRKSTPRWARVTSPGRRLAAADERRRRCRVVRRAERPAHRAAPPGASRPAAEWMRVISSASPASSGGQHAGEPPREHRLARARRADHEQVVAARCGDLERPARARLAADVGEVGPRRRSSAAERTGRRRARRGPPGCRRPVEVRAAITGTSGPSPPRRRSPGASPVASSADPRGSLAPSPGRLSPAGAPPSRPARPTAATCATRSRGAWPDAASTARAMARSNPAPSLRSCAGARLTVRRARGSGTRADVMPLRTRSRASCTARSASRHAKRRHAPATCASTSTRRASIPASQSVRVRATMHRA